jgi:hypothetical protein
VGISSVLSNVPPLEPRQQPRPCKVSLEPRPFSWCRRIRAQKEERDLFVNGSSLLQDTKSISMCIDLTNSEAEAQVRQHNQSVRRSGAERACYGEFCARCQASDPFAPHDVRCRGLRIVLENTVLFMTVWLARWRCRKCRYVFTDYPDFRTPVQAICCLITAEPGSKLRRAG